MAGEVFTGDKGTMKEGFQVGGPLGPAIEKDGNNFAVKDPSGNVVNMSLKDAAADSHAATLRDVKRTANVLIEFHFNGASAPVAGTNTGQYGICGKTGGTFNAGEIVYDDGASLTKIPVYKGMTITTACAVTGVGYEVSLVDNGFYAAESATNPYNWTMKGDGTATETGMSKKVRLDLGLNTVNSTSAIPLGSIIDKVELVIKEPYVDGTTIRVCVSGVVLTELMGIDENCPQVANSYIVEPGIQITEADQAGVIHVPIANAATEGSGFVVITYCANFFA